MNACRELRFRVSRADAAGMAIPGGARPLALGYTLFLVAPGAGPTRVGGSHVFRTGDRLILVFEPSEAGHLYVFARSSTGHSCANSTTA